tara:strand:+ start:442 stop:1194 length:753 start_codon:yes stop_codon:yes gene_type:complete
MPVSAGMRVTPLPSGLELSAGTIDKLSLQGTSGINPAVGATLETVCTQGGLRNLLSSAEQLKIKSNSANDTNGGSGHARRVKIKGIDANGAEVEENVNLNGTAAVTTTNSYRHVNNVFVNKIGSGNYTNTGVISVSNNADDTVLYEIAAGEGQQQSASYAIPADTNAYITTFMMSSTGPAQVSIWLNKAPDTAPFKQVVTTIVGVGAPATYQLPNPFQIPAGGIIEFRAKRLGSSDVAVACDFQLIFEKD